MNLEVTAIEGEEYMCFYPPAPVAASAHVRYGSKFTEGVFRPQTYRNLEWLQEDGQVTPFKWSGGVHEMLPWAAWLRAQVAIRHFGLAARPALPTLGRPYWSIPLDGSSDPEALSPARVLDALDTVVRENQALVVALPWPLAPHKTLFGRPADYRLTVEKLVMLGDCLSQA